MGDVFTDPNIGDLVHESMRQAKTENAPTPTNSTVSATVSSNFVNTPHTDTSPAGTVFAIRAVKHGGALLAKNAQNSVAGKVGTALQYLGMSASAVRNGAAVIPAEQMQASIVHRLQHGVNATIAVAQLADTAATALPGVAKYQPLRTIARFGDEVSNASKPLGVAAGVATTALAVGNDLQNDDQRSALIHAVEGASGMAAAYVGAGLGTLALGPGPGTAIGAGLAHFLVSSLGRNMMEAFTDPGVDPGVKAGFLAQGAAYQESLKLGDRAAATEYRDGLIAYFDAFKQTGIMNTVQYERSLQATMHEFTHAERLGFQPGKEEQKTRVASQRTAPLQLVASLPTGP